MIAQRTSCRHQPHPGAILRTFRYGLEAISDRSQVWEIALELAEDDARIILFLLQNRGGRELAPPPIGKLPQ